MTFAESVRLLLLIIGIVSLDFSWILNLTDVNIVQNFGKSFAERNLEAFLVDASHIQLSDAGDYTKDPRLAMAIRALSLTCENVGDFSSSRVWACTRLGELFHRVMNDPNSAIKVLNAAAILQEESPDVMYFLGQIYAEKNQPQTAYQHLRKAMIKPKFMDSATTYHSWSWRRNVELISSCYAPRELGFLYLRHSVEIASIKDAPAFISQAIETARRVCHNVTVSTLNELHALVTDRLKKPPPQQVRSTTTLTTSEGGSLPDLEVEGAEKPTPRDATLLLVRHIDNISPLLRQSLEGLLSENIVAGRYAPMNSYDDLIESALNMQRSARGSQYTRLTAWEVTLDLYDSMRSLVVQSATTTQEFCTEGLRAVGNLEILLGQHDSILIGSMSHSDYEHLHRLVNRAKDACL